MNRSLKKFIPTVYKSYIKRIFKNLKDSLCYQFYKRKQNIAFNNIIFVCKGNVCRSVFADLYFKKINTINMNIDSCGLDVDQGGNPPNEAIQVAREFDIDMSHNIAKNICMIGLNKGDLIIAMEFDQYKRLINDFPQHKQNIRLLKDYLPWPARLQCNIADPYGSDVKEFRRCFTIIKRALDCMLIELSENSVQR